MSVVRVTVVAKRLVGVQAFPEAVCVEALAPFRQDTE